MELSFNDTGLSDKDLDAFFSGNVSLCNGKVKEESSWSSKTTQKSEKSRKSEVLDSI